MIVRRGLRKAKRLAMSKMPKGRPRGVILMYHRIATTAFDPWSLGVSETSFESQLDVLVSRCYPMSLDDFVEAWHRKELPPRAVAVTFDDGYRDNYSHGLPALQRAGVPATVFVTTNVLDTTRSLWWEELCQIFTSEQVNDSELVLKSSKKKQSWIYNGPVTSGVEGRKMFDSVWEFCLTQPESERIKSMEQIRKWFKANGGRTFKLPEMLSQNDLRQLAGNKFITIGSHTVCHPCMSVERPEYNSSELVKSKEIIEALTGKTVTHFAYPYGDFSEDLIELVDSAGYSSACLAGGGAVTNKSHVFQLPRIAVPDIGGEDFDALLNKHL